tara:strand:+ start:26417 stop:27862 length:1446 start_codon:yes stop_codon:yes gene_type:complete
MNDTAHLLAAYLESRLVLPYGNTIPGNPGTASSAPSANAKNSSLSGADLRSISRRLSDATESLALVMKKAESRQFEARIYDIVKTKMNLYVYVTDHQGIVLYDSSGLRTGEDLSRMNDVYLTLRGDYGARSSRMVESDPQTGALYVAAPVRYGQHIVGVLSVVKPKDSVTPFIQLAQRRSLTAALLAACAIFLFAGLIFLWVSLPVRKLSRYVSDLRAGKRVQLPSLPRTEIGELGRALDDLRLELEGKNYVEKYVQTLNHEIKSPLTALQGSVELLEEDLDPARRAHLVENIKMETARIHKMIERMLDLATVENQSIIDRQQVSLLEILNAQLKEMPDRFIVHLPESGTGRWTVSGDPFLISIAVSNVLRNALDFADPESSIQVRLKGHGDAQWRTLEVENRGPVIPDYALPRIYDRFYSLPRATGRKSTGLGLPFVQEVMALHGGEVRIENLADGSGVVCRLTFPLDVTGEDSRESPAG